jgi:U2 small nuclear ribonucleoprotein A'
MKRLTSLLLSNNHITRIGTSLDEYIPKLKHLVLTNNKISSLLEIEHLASLKCLEDLCLLENPVFFSPHYRFFVIHRIPSLKSLDYQKIRPTERQEAARFFSENAEGQELLARILAEKAADQQQQATAMASSYTSRSSSSSAMMPPLPAAAPPKPAVKVLTESQKQEVREAISKATTKEEVDRIEQQLRTGSFPFRSDTSTRGLKRDRDSEEDNDEEDKKRVAGGSVGVLVT